MGEQRTPAQQQYQFAVNNANIPSNEIESAPARMASAAMARSEEVNEARIAAEATLRGSILDLKDQIGALNQKIAALECRRFECDRHLRSRLDALESTMEQMDSPAKPALDPVILGLAMAWRGDGSDFVRYYLIKAYRYYVRDFRQEFSGVAKILDTYGLEGSR